MSYLQSQIIWLSFSESIPKSLFVCRCNKSATRCYLLPYRYAIIDDDKTYAYIRSMRVPGEIKTCRDNSGSDVGVGSAITERGRRNDDAAIAESPAPAGIANWGWTGVPVAAGVSWPSVDRAHTSGWSRWWARTVARSSRRGMVARATTASSDTRSRG